MSNEPAGILRYPYEAITETTDFLQLTIFKYNTVNPGNELVSQNFTNQNPYSSLTIAQNVSKAKVLVDNGVIALPMPSNIQDSNSVSYEAGNLNKLAAEGLEAFGDLTNINAFGNDFGTQTAGALTDAGAKMTELLEKNKVKDLALKSLAAQGINLFGANVSLQSLLARSQGKILNPNMELLFNNVTLRTFRFSFKMTPRDENESTSIKSIIRSLKRNMAAKSRDLFLETPNIFELQYKKGNRPHPFLNLFKPCALSDMSINYTGENVYATYGDGTPLSMVMTLTFKELLPIYEEDYINRANFDGQSQDEVTDADLIYGITGNTQNDNVQGVGF